jgi:hypothetical protein
MLSVKVNVLPLANAPTFTVTDESVVELLIVPFPLIVQLCVTVPPVGLTVDVYVCVVLSHGFVSPAMVQVGVGLTVTVRVHWPGHPSRVMLSVKMKEPGAPPVTLTEAPEVDPLMVPFPLIIQLCVTTPPDGLTVEV